MKRESKIGQAQAGDAAGILSLIESTSGGGALKLLYTRRPDPVASLRSESPDTSLGVIRGADGAVRFMESCVTRPYYIAGKAARVTYVCNLRKEKGALPGVNWMRELRAYEGGRDEPAFCSILADNRAAARLLCGRGHRSAPVLTPICGYHTMMFSPKVLRARPGDGFFRMKQADSQELFEFLRAESSGCSLAPVFGEGCGLHGLGIGDFFGIREDGALAACGALWDQRSFRQYIVKSYRGAMRVLYSLRGPMAFFGLPALPPPGAAADVRLITLMYSKGGDAALMKRLLGGLAAQAGGRTLVLGLPDGDRWYPYFKKKPKLSFDSTLYWISGRPGDGREIIPGAPPAVTGPFRPEPGCL
jgi:hypothetical protein